MRDWQSHPEVQKDHLGVREGSGGPPVGLGWVGRPTQSSRRGWEAHRWAGRLRQAHPEIREGLDSHPEVLKPTQRSERVWVAHPEVCEGSRGYPNGQGGVWRITRRSGWRTRRSGRGWLSHPDV